MAEAIRTSFPEGTKVILPGGGLFMWVDLPEGVDALEMFDFVFQKNIAYVPGQFFCCDGSGKNAMRLNFSTTGEKDILRHQRVIHLYFSKFKKRIWKSYATQIFVRVFFFYLP